MFKDFAKTILGLTLVASSSMGSSAYAGVAIPPPQVVNLSIDCNGSDVAMHIAARADSISRNAVMTTYSYLTGERYTLSMTGTLDSYGRGTLTFDGNPSNSMTFFYDAYNRFGYSGVAYGRSISGMCSLSRSN